MVGSSRFSKGTCVRRRDEASWSGAALWAAVFFSVSIALSWFARPAEADKVEPESVHAAELLEPR